MSQAPAVHPTPGRVLAALARQAEVLSELRREARPVLAPEPRAAALAAGSTPRLGPELLREAERELVELHRLEQAALLGEAAELRMASRPSWSLLVGVRGADEGSWRRRCATEVGLALEGGLEVDGGLLACGVLGLEAWPGPEELALSAARLAPGVAAEVRVARALLVVGRRAEARRRLAGLELSMLPLAAELDGLRLRADLDLARGAVGGALRRLRRHLALDGAHEPALALLALAEELGARGERELARERLGDGRLTPLGARRLLADQEERRLLLGRPLSAPVRRVLQRELEALGPLLSHGRSS